MTRSLRRMFLLLGLLLLGASAPAAGDEFLALRNVATQHKYFFFLVEEDTPLGTRYSVRANMYVEGDERWKDLNLFSDYHYLSLEDAIFLSNGDFALAVASRADIMILIGNLISGLVEATNLTYQGVYLIGESAKPAMVEHKGLLYVAYARLPVGRFEKYEYTQIRYRVRTAPGRWTEERILYSASGAFRGPSVMSWGATQTGLILYVNTRESASEQTLSLVFTVPEEEPGA